MEKSYEALQQDLKSKIIENNNLMIENKDLIIENTDLKAEIENQKLIIQQLRKYIFGPKREKLSEKEDNIVEGVQTSMFISEETEEIQKEVEAETEKITYYRKKRNNTCYITYVIIYDMLKKQKI